MKCLVAAALITALTAAPGIASADSYGYRSGYYSDPGAYGPRYGTARVISVSPLFESVPVQREECWYEPVRYGDAYRGPYPNAYGRPANGVRSNTGAAVLGALVGGALGNQTGKGDGRKAATIAGAVIGAAVGNNVGARNQARYSDYRNRGEYYGDSVRRCRVVTEYSQDSRVVGYDVAYRYAGRTYRTTTAYHPGNTIQVRVDVFPAGSVAVR